MILSGTPGDFMPEVGSFLDWLRPDKVVHIILYAVFFYLLIDASVKQFVISKLGAKHLILLLLIGIMFGAITEILQAKVFVNRHGSVYDFLANIIGCLVGLAIYSYKVKKKSRKITNQ